MRKASLTKYIILFFILGFIYTESIAKSPTIKPLHSPTQPPQYSNPQYPETPPSIGDKNRVEPVIDDKSALSVFLDFFGDLSKNPNIQKNVLP